MENGLIELDTDRGREIGFTSEKFDGYLWKKDDWIYLSTIISKKENKGNLSELFKNILKQGYGIKVPTPFPKMKVICETHGFLKDEEYFEEAFEWIEVWKKEGGED